MPSPRKNEKKDEFIARCMSDEESKQTFPDEEQRAAFCYSQWNNKDKKNGRTMKKYVHLMDKIYHQAWFINPSTLDSISKQFIDHIKGAIPMMPMDDEEDEDEEDDMPMGTTASGIAMITIEGIIGKRLSMLEMQCGGVDVDNIKDAIQAAVDDPSIHSIILDINSPGGTVTGVPELAAFIAKKNKDKKCYAFIDSVCASAAYYLASQCEAIFVTPTAQIGSVGVYMLTVDESRALENEGIKINAIANDEATLKLAGASFKPMDEDEKEYFRTGVQKTYNKFKEDVLSKRKIDDKYLNGAVFDGEDAVINGFADGIVDEIEDLARMILTK